MKPKLDVCLTPQLLDLHKVAGKTVVIIDIFRASTTICTALGNGAKAIIPVKDPEYCKQYRSNGVLIAGEKNGLKLEGFDLGNSPYEYLQADLSGKVIALTTTNGTKSIEMTKNYAAGIYVGCFLNLTALSDRLTEEQNDVLLLCAGWRNHFNLEDTLFAGALVNKIRGDFDTSFDSTLGAEHLYLSAKGDLMDALKKASHYKRLKKFGAERDIHYCLRTDVNDFVPRLVKDKIVL